MKKSVFIIFAIIMFFIIIFPITVKAVQIDPNDYKPGGLNQSDTKEINKYGGRVAGIIQVVGTIVSVGAMMIIGIRYVLGSADEKAEYRERIIPYFIGAILLFGASNVVNIIYKMFAE